MGKRRNQQAYNLVRRGNRKRLRLLLGKHPELKTSNDAMLIYGAIWHNRGMLKWLLEKGVSPDGNVHGRWNTPLMQAAADGDISVMKLLLAYGADPNALNNKSENPLGFAVTWNQPEAVKLLVASGADVNNLDDSGPGRTQLDWAEMSQSTDVVQALLEMGGKRYSELKAD